MSGRTEKVNRNELEDRVLLLVHEADVARGWVVALKKTIAGLIEKAGRVNASSEELAELAAMGTDLEAAVASLSRFEERVAVRNRIDLLRVKARGRSRRRRGKAA